MWPEKKENYEYGAVSGLAIGFRALSNSELHKKRTNVGLVLALNPKPQTAPQTLKP